MPANPNQRIRSTIDRTSRLILKLSVQPSAENVHRFRTQSRRVETILQELVPDPSRNQTKLLKQLVRLRKKAGKIRDLDVQIAALRNLKLSQPGGRKAQLLRSLSEELSERQEQIAELLDKKTVRQIQKRLTRAAAEFDLPPAQELLKLATRKLEQLEIGNPGPSAKTMHHYRIVGKRARYIAELAEETAGARRFIDQLKRIQDLLGEWHDWLQLSIRSERTLGASEKSSLSATLQIITRTKFSHALAAVTETRSVVRNQTAATRKPPKPAERAITAVA